MVVDSNIALSFPILLHEMGNYVGHLSSTEKIGDSVFSRDYFSYVSPIP